MYYAKFDAAGNRETSIVEGVHFTTAAELKKYTDDGFIEISEEDQELYASNEYIRDMVTGLPIIRPPYVPTEAEMRSAKLNEINTWTAAAIVGGFTSNCTGASVRFDSDVDTQTTMQGIALNAKTERFAIEYPQGCPCRGYAAGNTQKTIHALTGQQVLDFCADLSAHIGLCKQCGWELQEAAARAKTKDDFDAITW